MKNLKAILGIVFLICLVILRILVENTKYIALSNILFPIFISLLIPWLLFEYQFKRQREHEEIKEKLKIHNTLTELLTRAKNRNLSNKGSFDFISSEIKQIIKIFNDNKHLLSSEICNSWKTITNKNRNKELLLSVDFSEKETDLIPLKIEDSFLNLIESELNKLKSKFLAPSISDFSKLLRDS